MKNEKNRLDFLRANVVTAEESCLIPELIELMIKNDIGAIPIIRSNKLIGIVSERDILRRAVHAGLCLEKTSAKEIMSKNVTTADIESGPEYIYQTLCNITFRHLPIMEKGQLVGMATKKNLRDGLITEDHVFTNMILDRKFKGHKMQYIWQCAIATLGIFITLLVFNAFSNAAIIASLGASTFIAFVLPHRKSSHPRFLIGGYVVGLIAGSLCQIFFSIPIFDAIEIFNSIGYAISGSIAVGLSIFIMSITNTEHPPAAGIALGLTLNQCDLKVIILIIAGICLLSTIKETIKPHLKDLL